MILNGDDDKLVTVKEVQGRRPIYFGLNEGFPIYADEIESKGLKGIACRIHTPKGTFSVVVPIPGHHMVYNALAGTAVGLAYGMELSEIQKGIESLQSLSGRIPYQLRTKSTRSWMTVTTQTDVQEGFS